MNMRHCSCTSGIARHDGLPEEAVGPFRIWSSWPSVKRRASSASWRFVTSISTPARFHSVGAGGADDDLLAQPVQAVGPDDPEFLLVARRSRWQRLLKPWRPSLQVGRLVGPSRASPSRRAPPGGRSGSRSAAGACGYSTESRAVTLTSRAPTRAARSSGRVCRGSACSSRDCPCWDRAGSARPPNRGHPGAQQAGTWNAQLSRLQ
jgi:hypothetical protein